MVCWKGSLAGLLGCRAGDNAPHRYRITCVAAHVPQTVGFAHNGAQRRPHVRTGCNPLIESTPFLPGSYLTATKFVYHPARGRGPDTQRTLVTVHTVAATRSAHIDARNSSPVQLERRRVRELAPCLPMTGHGVRCVTFTPTHGHHTWDTLSKPRLV
jgi:hypothetical protein